MTARNEVLDQAAHFAAAMLAIAPAIVAPSIATGAWAGFCMGMVRELTEEGRLSWGAIGAVAASPGSRLDIVFWLAGGAVAGCLG